METVSTAAAANPSLVAAAVATATASTAVAQLRSNKSRTVVSITGAGAMLLLCGISLATPFVPSASVARNPATSLKATSSKPGPPPTLSERITAGSSGGDGARGGGGGGGGDDVGNDASSGVCVCVGVCAGGVDGGLVVVALLTCSSSGDRNRVGSSILRTAALIGSSASKRACRYRTRVFRRALVYATSSAGTVKSACTPLSTAFSSCLVIDFPEAKSSAVAAADEPGVAGVDADASVAVTISAPAPAFASAPAAAALLALASLSLKTQFNTVSIVSLHNNTIVVRRHNVSGRYAYK